MSGTSQPDFQIDDHDYLTWGRLVKTLATGIDHLAGPLTTDAAGTVVTGPLVDPAAKPALAAALAVLATRQPLTRTQFLAVLAEAGLPNVVVPPVYQKVELSQTHDDVLAIRLPMRSLMLAREAEIIGGARYKLPDYVKDWVDDRISDEPITPELRLDYNSKRVAGYSIAHCEE